MMKYKLSYDQEQDLIVEKVEGEIDPHAVKAMATEFAELVNRSGCRKLLNDLRGAHITSSTFDIYNMPRIVDTQGVPISCRRAFLLSGSSEDFNFLETVSINVGQQVRIFINDMEAALEWLREE